MCLIDLLEDLTKKGEMREFITIFCGFNKPANEDQFRETIRIYSGTYWRKYDFNISSKLALKLYQEGRLSFTGGHKLCPGKHWAKAK
jgi:hypothetical protein